MSQPVPLGFTLSRQDHRHRPARWQLLLIGIAQEHQQDDDRAQMARNDGVSGQASILYICFEEHDEQYLLNRPIAMESFWPTCPTRRARSRSRTFAREIRGPRMAEGESSAPMLNNPRLRPSMDRIAIYSQNLFLMRGSRVASTIDISARPGAPAANQGDRSCRHDRPPTPESPQLPGQGGPGKVTCLVNGLKDIALAEDVPMVCIVSRRPGVPQGLPQLRQPLPARLVGIQLRDQNASSSSITRNTTSSRQGQYRVQPVPGAALPRLRSSVIGGEKNRGGQDNVDLEFREAPRGLLLQARTLNGSGKTDQKSVSTTVLTARRDRAP